MPTSSTPSHGGVSWASAHLAKRTSDLAVTTIFCRLRQQSRCRLESFLFYSLGRSRDTAHSEQGRARGSSVINHDGMRAYGVFMHYIHYWEATLHDVDDQAGGG